MSQTVGIGIKIPAFEKLCSLSMESVFKKFYDQPRCVKLKLHQQSLGLEEQMHSLYSQIEFHKNITSITQIIIYTAFHFKFFIQTMHRVATQNSHKLTDKTKDILNVG